MGDAAIKDRTEVSKNATAPSTQGNNIDEKDNRSKNTAALVAESTNVDNEDGHKATTIDDEDGHKATTIDDEDGHKVAEATTADDGDKGDITFLSVWNMETLKQRVEVFVDRFVDQLMDEKRKKKNILSKPKRTQSKRKVDELQDKVKEEMLRLDNHQAKRTSRKITDEKLEQ